MPAEWEPHRGTWLLWPERPDNWRKNGKPAQQAFAAVAAAIARFEPVTIGVNSSQYHKAVAMLPPTVRVVEIRNNDAWMRDCGPTFVKNTVGDQRVVDWEFNAWGGLAGGLYFPWDKDDQVASRVADLAGVDRYRAPFVLEGGSIHVDGQGTLLTTEECLLNPNRNPAMTKAEIEQALKAYTGVSSVLWLAAGVYLDETSGHVDNLACFLAPGVVALTWTDDHNDPQYPISKDALDRLTTLTDARGRGLQVIKVHQPEPVYITAEEARGVLPAEGSYPREAGDRMAASYINFYICNGAAIFPAFGDPQDQPALETLRPYLPGRQLVSVPAREILLGGGNIHCITQQQPAA
jgi:agmatine deiminase